MAGRALDYFPLREGHSFFIRRMTIARLSECLGIPRRTLFRYRKDHPDQAPKSFDDLEGWIEFIGKIKKYSAERTRPWDQKGTESSAEDQNDEYAEYSPGVERRERIIKLRLGNTARRTKLELLCRSVITVTDCEATMDRIRVVVSTDLLRLPGSLCDELANREPQYIQQLLNATLRAALDRLAGPENYL
jgi:hypothetical protein